MTVWLRRVRHWFGSLKAERRLEEELAFHREMKEAELRAEGMASQQAVLHAKRAMGSSLLAADDARAVWIPETLSAVLRDVRFGVRLLRRSPGFFVAATITLAVGIGANTAIYTLVDHIVVRPLPYPDPDRLVTIVTHYQRGANEGEGTSQNGATWFALAERVPSLDMALAGGAGGVNLSLSGRTAYVRQQRVSAGFFRVLGVDPILGREFLSEEDRAGGPMAAVLSHELWTRMFGEDRQVIGQSVVVKGQPAVIVGVMPKGFRSNAPADIWTPLQPSTSGEGAGQNYVIVGRIRRESSWPEASGQVTAAGNAIVGSILPVRPDVELSLRLSPLQRVLTSELRARVLMLWAAVATLLVLACLNVAGLILARSSSRGPELAIRIALGGGRTAILRQFLVESLVLAASGAVAGVTLGYVIARVVSARLQPFVALPTEPDARVLLLSVLAALTTGVVFGLLPAWQASHTDARSFFADAGGRTTTPLTRRWSSRCLVVSEVAIGLVLMIAAGLLLRTLIGFTALRPGFDATGVVAGRASLQGVRYRTGEAINALFTQTLDRIRQSPGVDAAAVALTLPYERAMNNSWRRPGETAPQRAALNNTYVTPDYFRALAIPLRRGRMLTASDSPTSTLVGVVNDAFVRQYARDSDPIGMRLVIGTATAPPVEIVGVVGDVQQLVISGGSDGPVAPLPAIYVPAAQVTDSQFVLAHTWFEPNWIVRTAGSQSAAAAAMRDALQLSDPQLPFSAIRTLDQIQSEAFLVTRLQAGLLTALAAIALLLCTVGVYGLIKHSTDARSRELAIRVALGAQQAAVVKIAMIPGVVLATVGVGVGLLIAILGAPVMRYFVFGISTTDPFTFAGAATILIATASAAALVPALRVRRLHLVRALQGW